MKKFNLIILTAFIILYLFFAYSFYYLGGISQKHEVTRTINENLEQGYSQAWAEHKALVDLNIIPADSLYIAIEED